MNRASVVLSATDEVDRAEQAKAEQLDHINLFVAEYAARALHGKWKKQSRAIASAVIDSGTRHGFDPLLLLAIIQNESRFDPEVVGTHGEIGLMQLKPDTAEWIAKKARIHWEGADSLRDPVANIRLGAAYLSMLRAKFGFDKDLYLAAYNMGVAHLTRLLSFNGHPQIYPQKTNEHYTQIYGEFRGNRAEAVARIGAI